MFEGRIEFYEYICKLVLHHINTLTKINVKNDICELPTFN